MPPDTPFPALYAFPTDYSAQLLLLLASAMVAGLARGFSGFGGALIFVPLASSLTDPKTASGLLLLIDGVMTLGMVPSGWRHADRREVFTMLAGAVFGVPASAAALSLLPSLTLRWIISVVVLGLLLFLISGWRYHGKPRPALTVAVGGLAGLFGGAAQMSGPPIVAYWLGGALPRAIVRANLVLYFALATVISAASYLMGGILTAQVFLLAALIGPGYGLGLLLGGRMFGLASETTFRRICFILIAAAAVAGSPLLDSLRP